MNKSFFWLALCAGCFFLGYGAHRFREKAVDRHGIASINGELISKRELDEYMVGYRLQALEQLLKFKAVQQYANQLKITVSDAELKKQEKPASQGDKLERYLAKRQATEEALLRKIILSRFTEEQKRESFKILGPELVRYSITLLVLARPEDEKAFRQQLSEGASLESLIPKFSRDVPSLGSRSSLKDVQAAALVSALGPQVGYRLPLLPLGEVSESIPSNLGPIILRVDRKLEDYKELEPYLNDALVESQRALLSYQLMVHARVETDFNPLPGREWKPLSKSKTIASPAASPSGPMNTLPSPKPNTPAPSGLEAPSLTSTPTVPTELPGLNQPVTPNVNTVPKPKPGLAPIEELPGLSPTATP